MSSKHSYKGWKINNGEKRNDPRTAQEKKADAKRNNAISQIDDKEFAKKLGLESWFGLP